MRTREILDRPEVQWRIEMARYASAYGIRPAAREFGVSRNRIRRALRKWEAFRDSRDAHHMLNRSRGKTHRTPDEVEELIVAYKQERQGLRSCPNIARQLWLERRIDVSRQTVWNVLRRRKVFAEPKEKRPVRRFQMGRCNVLWQIDLKEAYPTAIGAVWGVALLDDHSRFLLGCCFFQDKRDERVLYTIYRAFRHHGLPLMHLCDRGSQFRDNTDQGRTRYQQIMARLGVATRWQEPGHPQSKGKIEKFIQFWTRDFLAIHAAEVTSLFDLNRQAMRWCLWYNRHHSHEALGFDTPANYYVPGPRISLHALQAAFTQELRRKVRSDATISFQGQLHPVPARYIGWDVFVHALFGNMRIYAGADMRLIAQHRYPWW